MEWTKEQREQAEAEVVRRFHIDPYEVEESEVTLQCELTAALSEAQRLRSQLAKDDVLMGELAVGGRWISVNQELPPEDRDVWALQEDGVQLRALRNGGEWFEHNCAGEFEPPNRDITHWQSLPAPPSGEQAAAVPEEEK